MKFLRLLKKHWKISSAFVAIIIATTIGVVMVKASTVTLSLDTASISFATANASQTITAQVNLVLDSGVSTGSYNWAMNDSEVATVSANEGVGTVMAKGAGKTILNVRYTLSDGTYASKTVPVMVPLSVTYDSVSGILTAGSNGIVTCNAASTKYVEWTSSNSNVVSVVADSSAASNGSVATVTAVSGGTATITASIPSDSLSYSFNVTVGVSIEDTSVTVNQGSSKPVTTNSNSATDVFWWSADENIATVSNGVIYGVYAGTTTVYASCKDGDYAGNAGDFVTVNVPYEVFSPAETVLVGDQVSFTTTANPTQVNYASDNNNVLSYDPSTGKFTANGTGTANISVTWNGQVQTVTINVIDGFSLSTTAMSLNIGASGSVTANVSNTSQPIHWTVADDNMASLIVSEDGLTATVTALSTGDYGYTTLVATQEIDGVVKTASCKIYILNPVNSLTLMYNGNPITETISIAKNTSLYINAYLNFGEATVPDNTTLSWVSSDPSVITVNPTTTSGQQQLCQVMALKGGKATITVVSEDGLYIATADFYVTEGVTSITLDKNSVTAQMALEKFQLTATILPESAGVDTSVVWASLDENVVKVDQNGLVTFVGPGETYISATAGADSSKVAYCKFLITQQVEGITMDYDRITLNVGDDYRLTAVIAPSNATNQNVSWSSSNEGVVTVDASGMVHAVASGSATIIAQTEDGGYIDMTNVTVLQPVTTITLSKSEISVKKGTEFWLNATILPETADNKKVTWSSSDTTLATVDQDGKVTTLAVGTVTIACVSQDNGTAAYCIVDITEPVTGLTLNTYYQEMVSGTKFVIVPTVLPIDAPNKSVTYTSSDTEIATVDSNGIVTALKGGDCEIIVTTVESNLSAKCTIKVKEYVTSVEISGNPTNLNVNKTVALSVAVGSESASNKNVIWSSSNTSLATVDQSGKVTGVKPGNVVITATAADGSGVSDSVVIRVINPVTSISLDHTKVTIYVGDTIGISATVNPANASIKGLTWTSDDETIAKVYSDGDVEGIAPGRTIVHATSNDGNKVVASCTVIVKASVPASTISINSTEITMLKGKTRNLTARIYPTNTRENIRWESSDTSVVTVDANGKIITVGAGQAEITAYSSNGTVSDTCIVHSMAMSCTDLKIEQYDTFNLYVDGAPAAVSWRSSNPRIASVTQAGMVTARMPGECVITATVQGKTVTCYIKVMAVDPGKFINTLGQ